MEQDLRKNRAANRTGMAIAVDTNQSPYACHFNGRIGNHREEECSESTSNNTFLTTLDYEKLASDDEMSLDSFRTGVEDIAEDLASLDTASSTLQSVGPDDGSEELLESTASLSSSIDETDDEDSLFEKVFIKDGENSYYVPKYKFYKWIQSQPATKYDADRHPNATPPLLHSSLHGTEYFDMEDRKRHYPRVVDRSREFNIGTSLFGRAVSFNVDRRVPGDDQFQGCDVVKHPREYVTRDVSEADVGSTEGSNSEETVNERKRKSDVAKRIIGSVFKRISSCFRNNQ